ncbi:MAG: hypothetical protein IIA03_12650 [Proteobacteria bacterium]|nr:hypothetical protein [Pseudomonadota bacterium]
MTGNGTLRVLDPTYEPVVAAQGMAERPGSLNGKLVGLLANEKRNAEPLLEAVYDVLAERFDLAGRRPVNKGDASRPADPQILDDLAAQVDVVITANGD